MKTRIEQVWDEILKSEPMGPRDESSYVLRRLDPHGRFNIFAGVDGVGHLMLSIGVEKPPPFVDLESDALDYFRQQRADGTWLMSLRLRAAGLGGVFSRLCQDLVDATMELQNEMELTALAQERLRLWRRLFELGIDGLLSPSALKGLMAELLVLESQLTARNRTPMEVITAWNGPSGADQDFQFRDVLMEVKAVGPGAVGVTISSLEQLDSAVPIRLLVLTLRASAPAENGALGLNELVRRLEDAMHSSSESLSLFRRRLLEAGYVEDVRYDATPFQCLAVEDFEVNAAFPKVTRADVPQAVSSAVYVLSLSALRDGE